MVLLSITLQKNEYQLQPEAIANEYRNNSMIQNYQKRVLEGSGSIPTGLVVTAAAMVGGTVIAVTLGAVSPYVVSWLTAAAPRIIQFGMQVIDNAGQIISQFGHAIPQGATEAFSGLTSLLSQVLLSPTAQ